MAVDSYTYGTLAGLQVKAGWVVPDRTFSDSTTPSTTEVEGILDKIGSEIHMKLAEAGYPVDTKADVTTNAPRAVTWLEQLNEVGAACDIIQTYAIAGDPESGNRPSVHWCKRYQDGLKMIRGGALDFLGMSRDRDLSSNLVGTWYKNTDGVVKKPIFKRDTFDYPSSRSLTKEDT